MTWRVMRACRLGQRNIASIHVRLLHLYTSAYVSIRQHTHLHALAYDLGNEMLPRYTFVSCICIRQHTSAYASAYVSIRLGQRNVASIHVRLLHLYTSAYVSIRICILQHTTWATKCCLDTRSSLASEERARPN
jgi:hypothetical protein